MSCRICGTDENLVPIRRDGQIVGYRTWCRKHHNEYRKPIAARYRQKKHDEKRCIICDAPVPRGAQRYCAECKKTARLKNARRYRMHRKYGQLFRVTMSDEWDKKKWNIGRVFRAEES